MDVGSAAAFALARYVMRHHGCESYTPNTDDDACGDCVPCHAVGVYEGDEDSYVALAELAAAPSTPLPPATAGARPAEHT